VVLGGPLGHCSRDDVRLSAVDESAGVLMDWDYLYTWSVVVRVMLVLWIVVTVINHFNGEEES
jgi:hypothetical protein